MVPQRILPLNHPAGSSTRFVQQLVRRGVVRSRRYRSQVLTRPISVSFTLRFITYLLGRRFWMTWMGESRHGQRGPSARTGEHNFSTFSLWDTFRAAHPTYTLIEPERVPLFMNTLIRMAEQSPGNASVAPDVNRNRNDDGVSLGCGHLRGMQQGIHGNRLRKGISLDDEACDGRRLPWSRLLPQAQLYSGR